MAKVSWSRWRPFPNPKGKGILHAPFGPGVYELRRKDTKELILVGMSKNCAHRMTSLFPSPVGAGTRRNSRKSSYVRRNLAKLQYRCGACKTERGAKKLERLMRSENGYKYPT